MCALRASNKTTVASSSARRAKIVAAGLLLFASWQPLTSHADAFAEKSANLTTRVASLEAQLNELRAAQASAAENSPASAVLSSGLPEAPPEVSNAAEFEPPQGFVLLGQVDGKYFVRDGTTHRLLDEKTFARFKQARAIPLVLPEPPLPELTKTGPPTPPPPSTAVAPSATPQNASARAAARTVSRSK